MKSRCLFTCIAFAGSLSLSSCYDPYYSSSSRGFTVTDYEPGYVVRSLPTGYHTTVIDGNQYYHHDGVYYRSRGGSYVVVERPALHRVDDRDRDGMSNRYDRRPYRNDDYSREVVADRRDSRRVRDRDFDEIPNRYDQSPYRYDDVEVIRRLPSDYQIIDYRGDRYYIVDDNYYRPRGDLYIRVRPPF